MFAELLNKQTIKGGRWTRQKLSEDKKEKRDESEPECWPHSESRSERKTQEIPEETEDSMTVGVSSAFKVTRYHDWILKELEVFSASKSSWNKGIGNRE